MTDLTAPAVVQLNELAGGMPAKNDFQLGDFLAETLSASASFIFRPGGVAGENVYTDFTTLWAALKRVQGFRIVLLDGSLAANVVTVPAASYDFENGLIEWRATENTLVQLADGLTIFNSPRLSSSRFQTSNVFVSLSTSPIMTVADNLALTRAEIRGSATSAFVDISSGIFRFDLIGTGAMFGALAAPGTVNLTGTALIFVLISLGGQLEVGSVYGAVGTSLFFQPIGSAGFYTFTGPMPGFLGTVTYLGSGSRSSSVGYTPVTGADWVDPDPQHLQDAVDRIASAVAGLLAAPIP